MGASFMSSSALSGLLQRKCACGGSPGIGDRCAECLKDSLRHKRNDTATMSEPSARASQQDVFRDGAGGFDIRFGHEFRRVPIYPREDSTAAAPGDRRGIFINGPGDTIQPQPKAPAPTKKDPTPPSKPAANCPTDIQVSGVGPANDVDFGKNGFLTGWGGISLMEVSDPSVKTWDGTVIHENLKSLKNTCGKRGKNACSNQSSDQAGGTAGSTFKVGEESNFLGKAKLAAKKNKFYDLHVFATKEASLLHELKKEACEIQCSQTYDCGGKKFGPEFVVTYAMIRDVVKDGGKSINVTRVGITKTAKSADSTNANP